MPTRHVQKRNGSHQPLHFDKITTRLTNLCQNIEPKLDFIDPTEITQKIVASIYDGVTTQQIDELTAETCASRIPIHSEFGELASRIIISNHQKTTSNSFLEVMERLYNNKDLNGNHVPLVAEDKMMVIRENIGEIEKQIDYDRDFKLDYFAFKTLERAYLQKIRGKIVERVQHMWMRVSIGIHGNDLENAFKTYHGMSQLLFTHATPTLFNSCTPSPQLLSCFLLGVHDSIDGIYKGITDCARISKWAGGIGCWTTNVRAKDSMIRGTNGKTSGIVPMLRVFNETARYVNQAGRRNGSFAIYIEPWHADILDFLELKKSHGDENSRARDLFYALWIPDLFMQRVKEDGKWSLFCPDECPGLADVVGDDFKDLYEKYENDKSRVRETYQAREVWQRILVSQIETGTPYVLYKDAANLKSNQKNLGTIKSSNLCTEIIEYSDDKEYACCTLASIALPRFIETSENGNKIFNFRRLMETTKQVTRNLDKVIDLNYYPVIETEKSNKRHRPLGIGVQGLADTYAMMGWSFDDERSRNLNKQMFAAIYYASMNASLELAKEKGEYDTFRGSPLSYGKFQFDLWGQQALQQVGDIKLDWDALREKVVKHGVRNSLLLAPMPTASTSQILGNNECIEPFTSNLYSRRTIAGDFMIINKHLQKEMEKRGLWSKDIKDAIILNNGSVQGLSVIPQDLQEIFKTAWDLSQKVLIDQAADRGIYVCQSQSLNLFLQDPTASKVSGMHMYGWKKGLKTGMYYLRTRAKARAQQFTIDPERARKLTSQKSTIQSNQTNINTITGETNAPEECQMCSA